MATQYGAEGAIKEILAVSYSTAEPTVIGPSNINRYWVEEKGQQFIAYIEIDAFPTGPGSIKSWSLGYHELMEIKRATKAMHDLKVVAYGADSRLPNEYKLEKEHQQLIKFDELMRATSATPLTMPEELKPLQPYQPNPHKFSISSIPSPSTLDVPEAAFLCSCPDGCFCPEVLAFMRTREGINMAWADIRKRAPLGWMRMALPFFGTILHRVDCRISTEKDWEDDFYLELTVRVQTHRPDPITQFFTSEQVVDSGVNPFGWIYETVENDLLTEPAAKQQIDVVNAFMDLTAGGNHGCTASYHNYGSTQQLRQFLNRNQPHVQWDIYAQVMSTMYYTKCIICYRASELALTLIDVS